MEFGIFSNDRRPTRPLGEAWKRDVDEMVVADEAGFTEAWISEHQINADMLVARTAPVTRRIRLGSAIRVLPRYHPLQIATEALASDHLTDGRYMLGVGPGFLKSKMVEVGLKPDDMRAMMEESLDVILQLFAAKGPIDHDGRFWSGKGMNVDVEPLNGRIPPVAVSVATAPPSAAYAAARGLMVLTPDFTPNYRLREFNEAMEEAATKAGRVPNRGDLRTCRVVYVAETDRQARDDMRPSYTDVIKWEIVNTPWHQLDRIPPGGTLEDITFDHLVDTGNLFIGSPDTVRQMIEHFYAEVGGFGLLMFHAGRDYATPEKLHHSMRMFMKEVAPALQRLKPTPGKATAVA
jgi:alkanesulfonate monooxygenase SsuD/methylene tetrahydromethanopterin reductase-like flavin-dependent oxidoreductase (luciferase family)